MPTSAQPFTVEELAAKTRNHNKMSHEDSTCETCRWVATLAAAREEQRELDVRAADRWFASVPPPNQSPVATLRATPLDATPLADRIKALEADAQMLSDDDDACHRLLDKALGEVDYATRSMETLLERLPRLIADRDAKEEARSQESESQGKWMHRAQKAERDLGNVFENLDLNSLNASLTALRADLATAAEVTARLTEERDDARALHDDALRQAVIHARAATQLSDERDTLRAQRDAAWAVLEEIADYKRSAISEARNIAYAALLLARGTP